jgi:hypothetical protein
MQLARPEGGSAWDVLNIVPSCTHVDVPTLEGDPFPYTSEALPAA